MRSASPAAWRNPARPMARRAIPARASRPAARAVNAPPSSTPRPPPRWPGRARPGHQQRHHRFRAHHAGPHRPRDSLAAGAVPTQPRPFKGARHCGPPMHRPAASPVPRPAARRRPAGARRPAPAPHANTPAGQPQAAAANSAANVATVLNAIAGDPATAAGKTPADRRHRGRAPPKTRPPPPAPRWPRRVRPPARWARPCAKPCRPAACSTNHTWPIWPSAAPTHPSCAKNRRPTSSRPTPSSSNTARPPRAHAPRRPPAVAPAARTRPPPAAPMRPRPARRSTASTRT